MAKTCTKRELPWRVQVDFDTMIVSPSSVPRSTSHGPSEYLEPRLRAGSVSRTLARDDCYGYQFDDPTRLAD